MQGELGTAKAPGKLRRYRIDLRAKTLREEIVDAGSHEFPMIDPRAALQKHAIGYLTFGGRTTINSGVKRIDYRSGAAKTFDFGADVATGEPVFASRPGGVNDDGWLIVQCLDGSTERVLRAVRCGAPRCRPDRPHPPAAPFADQFPWLVEDGLSDRKTGHAGANRKMSVTPFKGRRARCG